MKTVILATLAVLAPAALWAADDIKPFDGRLGLWETTSTTEMTGMPAMPAMPQMSEEQMSKIPAAQRAQMEAMMKNRGNLGAPRTTVSKSCMTKDSFARAMEMGQQENCTRKVVSSSSSKQEIHVECKMGQGTSIGDMVVERVDAEHSKGNMLMKMNMAQAGAQAMTMKMSFTNKWVASDCGDVKPLGAK